MINEQLQPDQLHKYGWDFRQTKATPTEATFALLALRGTADEVLEATLYGPFCKFSNTLPYKIPLRRVKSPISWVGIVTDVCYWTPNLPLQYRLTVKVRLAGTLETRDLTIWVALKRFGIKGQALSLDGERYVLRAYATRGLELAASDDEAWKMLREQRAALICEELDPALMLRAGWMGIPVFWDRRDRELSFDMLWAARSYPALHGVLVDEGKLYDKSLHQGDSLLWIVARGVLEEGQPPKFEANEPALLALLVERARLARVSMYSELPLLIAEQLDAQTKLADRRQSCDALQAATAESGSYAGYLLL